MHRPGAAYRVSRAETTKSHRRPLPLTQSLFVSEPTRGIDIGAKKLILDHLVKLNREEGLTIVMTSSELAELRSICDRIAIVYQGKLEGILLPTDSDRDFGLMMAGEYHKIHRKEAV